MKRNRLSVILISLLAIISFSCTTAGRQIDAEQVKQNIQIAKSTTDDVLRVCGEPLSKTYDAGTDIEVWHYAYIQKTVTPLGVLTHELGVGTEWKSDRTVVDVYLHKSVVTDLQIDTGTTVRLNHGR